MPRVARNGLARGLAAACALIGALAASACATKNIHPELKEDTRVMVRKWTLPTRVGIGEAGDRGTEFSNPVIVDNTLVFGNRSVGLAALYPTINQQRWALPIHGGVVSELSVDQGSVYFGGGDGFLYSVNLDNGRVNWRYEIRSPVVSRPSVSGGRVFVTTADDAVYAFDAATGKWLWHYRRRSSPSATIYGASMPLADGNEVLVGLSDGFIVSLGIQDGQLKWERKLHSGTKFTDVDAKPVLDGAVIYIPSYDGALYALKRQGGDILWKFDAGGSKSVILDANRVYLPSSDGTVYALQKDSGKLLWKFSLDGGTPTNLALTDRYLVFGSSYQYFYAIDRASGQGVYRFNVGSEAGFYGSPAFDPATQRLYILSTGGNLYAFGLRQPPRKTFRFGSIDPYEFR